MEVQYLTNGSGERTAVQLSIKDWDQLLSDPNIYKMLQGLRQAWREMSAYEAGDRTAGMSKETFFASLK